MRGGMSFAVAIGGLARLGAWAQSAEHAPVLAERDLDVPSPSQFLRHPYPAVAVLGDYVYIDGGELSQLVDGQLTEGQPSYPLNATLSLPLHTSWTNDSVTPRLISKDGSPRQNLQAIWADPPSASLYTWGGRTPWFGAAAETQVWKFAADGAGGGSWAAVTPSNVVDFFRGDASRPASAAFATNPQSGVGYALGGLVDKYTETGGGDDTAAVSGLVSLAMRDGLTWKNTSTVGKFGQYGTAFDGRLEWVPFGSKEGLLLVLGGNEAPVGPLASSRQIGWNALSFVDPATGKWYSQTTAGVRPMPRSGHCSVGVAGPNGTYEIFIYGGGTNGAKSYSDEVFVLSLPGFVFFKSPHPGTPRGSHACVRVGKSQVLSVGGTNGALGTVGSLSEPDPWKQGLGILNLTDLTWENRYDAVDTAEYTPPQIVRDWYAQNGLSSVEWGSDEIRELFASGPSSSSGNSGGEASHPSSSGLPRNVPGSSRPRVGAVVGGVVGGVAGIAILATLLGVLLARRRKQGGEKAQQQDQEGPVEGYYNADQHLRSYPDGEKLHGAPVEAAAWPSHPELEAPRHFYELSAPNQGATRF